MNKKFGSMIFFVWIYAIFLIAFGAFIMLRRGEFALGAEIHPSIFTTMAGGFIFTYIALKSLQKRIEDLEKKVGGKAS